MMDGENVLSFLSASATVSWEAYGGCMHRSSVCVWQEVGEGVYGFYLGIVRVMNDMSTCIQLFF